MESTNDLNMSMYRSYLQVAAGDDLDQKPAADADYSFDQFKAATQKLKTLAIENIELVRLLVDALFKYMALERNSVAVVWWKQSGLDITSNYFGDIDECVYDGTIPHLTDVGSLDEIINYRLNRPLNYLNGVLIDPIKGQTVADVADWLIFFEAESNVVKYFEPYRSAIKEAINEADPDLVKAKLRTMVRGARKDNTRLVPNFIEMCFQIIDTELNPRPW